MKLSNHRYDQLKFLCTIGLPALSTLILGVGQVLSLDFVNSIVAILVLLNTFLGTVLQINTSQFNKNDDNLDAYLDNNGADEDTGLPNLGLTLTTDPAKMPKDGVIRVKYRDKS